GPRLMECLRLRVKDIELTRNENLVRGGKGDKDRVTVLPATVKEKLSKHLDRVRRLHERDLQAGIGRVQLPDALARKYPNADREWGWQWVLVVSVKWWKSGDVTSDLLCPLAAAIASLGS
ncbi:MAG: hypothetical protein ACE5HV_18210, partial [Acidobacteriota bacterium]